MRTVANPRPPILASATGSIASALFGGTKRAILAVLFSRVDEAFYLRELAAVAGIAPSSLQRELATLVAAGILTREQRGLQVYFQANRDSPVFSELQGLVVKSFGVADVLRNALAPMAERIDLAFIYGSIARGDAVERSDVDLFVVGAADYDQVLEALRSAEKTLGREVNPTVFRPEEIRQKIAEKNNFVKTVLNDRRIMLIGGGDELRGLAKERGHQAASDEQTGARKPAGRRRALSR